MGELPELTTSFSDEQYATFGKHGIDIYECRDARQSAYERLRDQYDEGNSQWDLRKWRTERPESDSVLEDAIHSLRCVDGAPIEFGPTAFLGWFTNRN